MAEEVITIRKAVRDEEMKTLFQRLAACSLLAAAVFLAAFSPASGARQCPPEPKGEKKTLKLFAKDPSTWKIIPHGARGVLSFNEGTGAFTFAASKLKPEKEYSLVRHDEGEREGDLLAQGISDGTGGLNLSGTWRLWRGKVWLIPTTHTAPSSGRLRLTSWRPKQMLFEEKILGVAYPCKGGTP